MTLFIWHQTAFITVSSVGLLAGRVPGLLTAPTGGVWVAERLAWLPLFAIVLSGLCLVFRRAERALGTAERRVLRTQGPVKDPSARSPCW